MENNIKIYIRKKGRIREYYIQDLRNFWHYILEKKVNGKWEKIQDINLFIRDL